MEFPASPFQEQRLKSHPAWKKPSGSHLNAIHGDAAPQFSTNPTQNVLSGWKCSRIPRSSQDFPPWIIALACPCAKPSFPKVYQAEIPMRIKIPKIINSQNFIKVGVGKKQAPQQGWINMDALQGLESRSPTERDVAGEGG